LSSSFISPLSYFTPSPFLPPNCYRPLPQPFLFPRRRAVSLFLAPFSFPVQIAPNTPSTALAPAALGPGEESPSIDSFFSLASFPLSDCTPEHVPFAVGLTRRGLGDFVAISILSLPAYGGGESDGSFPHVPFSPCVVAILVPSRPRSFVMPSHPILCLYKVSPRRFFLGIYLFFMSLDLALRCRHGFSLNGFPLRINLDLCCSFDQSDSFSLFSPKTFRALPSLPLKPTSMPPPIAL